MKHFLSLLVLLFATSTTFADGPGVQGRVFEVKEDGGIVGVVPGAKIEFKGGVTTTTDGAGFYRVDLSPGSYFYKVTADGFKDEDSGRGLQLQLSEGYAVYNFALMKGENDPDREPPSIPENPQGKLEGRVFEKISGNPGIGGAVVTLRHADGSRDLVRVISSGKQNGQYQVSLRPGNWRASVSADGFETLVDPDLISIAEGKTTKRDFGLNRPKPETDNDQGIRGTVRVVAGNQKPVKVQDIKVTVLGAGENQVTGSPKRNGSFEFKLPAGLWRVEASAEGYETARSGPVQVFPDRYSHVKLVLRGDLGFKIQFTVTDAKTKRPLPGTAIALNGNGETLEGVTGRLGELSLRVPQAGSWGAVAKREGYQSWTETLAISGPKTYPIALTPGKDATEPPPTKRPTRLSITVRDRLGNGPIGGASVTARLGSQRLSSAPSGMTDGKGQVNLELPGKGLYTVLVRANGYKAGGERTSVGEGESKNLTVYLGRSTMTETPPTPTPIPVPETKTQSLSIQVVGRGNQPLPNASVSIAGPNKLVKRGTTDSSGVYQLEGAPAGYYSLRAEAKGYSDGLGKVQVRSGQSTGMRITLSPAVVEMPPGPQSYFLAVDVANSQGRAIPGAAITVQSGSRIVARGSTSVKGSYQFALPGGIYVVRASANGYQSSQAVVQVNQPTSRVRLTLVNRGNTNVPGLTYPTPIPDPKRPGMTIQVFQNGGGPIPGATVTIAMKRQTIARGTTDRAGTMAVNPPGPGVYSVRAEARGYVQGGTVVSYSSSPVVARIQLNRSGISGGQTVPGITVPGNRVPQITTPGGTTIVIPGFQGGRGPTIMPNTGNTQPPPSEISPSRPSTPSIKGNITTVTYLVQGKPPGRNSQWRTLGTFSSSKQAQTALASYQRTYGALKWQLRVTTGR